MIKIKTITSPSWGGRRQNEKTTNCRFCRNFVAFLGGDKKLQDQNEKTTICRFFVAFFVVFCHFSRIFMVFIWQKFSLKEDFPRQSSKKNMRSWYLSLFFIFKKFWCFYTVKFRVFPLTFFEETLTDQINSWNK